MECVNTEMYTTFDCYGLKSSIAYVKELSSRYNFNFICEHWLKPSDIQSVKECLGNKWSYFKSSMKADEVVLGRPFGGVGFVCELTPELSYNIVNCDSDRIAAIKVKKNNVVLLTLIGAYLPTNTHTELNMEEYIEGIDQIKCLLDSASPSGPTVIMGDLNTVLPQQPTLKQKWYKNRPFSPRSGILYDMISQQEMIVANFVYKQGINYTYAIADAHSYIDHIIIPQYCINMLKSCEILCNDRNNVSDHFALCCDICLPITYDPDSEKCSVVKKSKENLSEFPKYDWNNFEFQENYEKIVKIRCPK